MASVHLVRCYCVTIHSCLVVFSFCLTGKVVLGWLADRYGYLNILWACTTMSAMSVFCLWAPASTGAVSDELTKRALFITYVILYGITSGTYVSLLPPVIFDIVGPVSHYYSYCCYTFTNFHVTLSAKIFISQRCPLLPTWHWDTGRHPVSWCAHQRWT
jgi:MFS family permease